MKDKRNLSLVMDFYELTMSQCYFNDNKDKEVVFDLFYRKNPDDGGYCVFAGLEQVVDYVSNLHFEKEDIDDNKGMSILAYISWLVLIPIFAAKKSKYAQFHANQGLILAIIDTAYWIINGVITGILMVVSPIASAIVGGIMGLCGLGFLVLAILGIVNAASGKAKELPVIGKYKILK